MADHCCLIAQLDTKQLGSKVKSAYRCEWKCYASHSNRSCIHLCDQVWVPSGATAAVADPHAASGAIHTLQQQQPQQQQRQADQVYQLQRQLSQRDYEVMRLRQQLVRQGEELAQLKDQLSKQQEGQHLGAGV